MGTLVPFEQAGIYQYYLHQARALFTQQVLGHKNPSSTQRYIDMAKAYGDTAYDEYESRFADTMEEVQKLIDVGFEYHIDVEGHKLFRRKKDKYDGLL